MIGNFGREDMRIPFKISVYDPFRLLTSPCCVLQGTKRGKYLFSIIMSLIHITVNREEGNDSGRYLPERKNKLMRM